MLIALAVITGVILALAVAVYVAELQSTISFIVGRGGFWLDYSSGIGRMRLTGFQLRLSEGRQPRAWMRRPVIGTLKKADFHQTIAALADPHMKPLNIPLRGALDIGVNIIIRELDINARLGIEGDAAATAMLCGAIVIASQSLRALSTRGKFVPRGEIIVRPVFNTGLLSVRLKCILAIKARHIMREVIESHIRRRNDGQSSDREHHADHDGKYSQHG